MKNSDMPAMPSDPIDTQEGDFETGGGRYLTSNGLTKREYFAAMALQGLCAKYGSAVYKESPANALLMADALLKELDRDK